MFLKDLECFLDQKSPLSCWKLFSSLRQLFPGGGVQSDDGFRGFPSNRGEPEARIQAQEKHDNE
jgi:hypothetical protein